MFVCALVKSCLSGVLKSHYGEGAPHLALELGPGPDGQEALQDVGRAEVEFLEGPVEPFSVFFPVE